MDIETLYEISQVLQVSVPQLTDIGRRKKQITLLHTHRKSPFFQAKMLYFYFYDGRYNRMKDGVINIHEKEGNGSYRATLSICSVSGNGRSSESYYNGSVLYSDMLIRFSFCQSVQSAGRRSALYFQSAGVSNTYRWVALRYLQCRSDAMCIQMPGGTGKQELNEELRKHLLFTKTEPQRWKKLNMLLIDNYENLCV